MPRDAERVAQRVLDALRKRALEFKYTPTIGRSHGIHAEPVTFGLKLALMYDELGRAEARLNAAGKAVAVCGEMAGDLGATRLLLGLGLLLVEQLVDLGLRDVLPAHLRGDAIRKAADLFAKAGAEVRERVFSGGAEVASGTAEEFATLIRNEMNRWGKLIREAAIRAE